jgi:hypothetical protein
MPSRVLSSGLPESLGSGSVEDAFRRAQDRRSIEMSRQHVRNAKTPTKEHRDSKGRSSADGPIPGIPDSVAAEESFARAEDRRLERRVVEQRKTVMRSPPLRSPATYSTEDELVFVPRPHPKPYSQRTLIPNAEMNAKKGTRAHGILALRRSGIAAHDSFNDGLRTFKSVSQLRGELQDFADQSPNVGLAANRSTSSLPRSRPLLRNSGKIAMGSHSHSRVRVEMSEAPKTKAAMIEEYKRGKHRRRPVVQSGLPYRGLRSKKKFPSGFLFQKTTTGKHRMYKIENEKDAIKDYHLTSQAVALQSMSVTGGVMEIQDALDEQQKKNGQGGGSVYGSLLSYDAANGNGGISQLASEVSYAMSESRPPRRPGERPRRRVAPQGSSFSGGGSSSISSDLDDRWHNRRDDIISNFIGSGGHGAPDTVPPEGQHDNGPFHFMFFDDMGKEQNTRSVHERTSFCPGTPHGRRVYWEENHLKPATAADLANKIGIDRPLSSSYILPPNTKRWGTEEDTIYGKGKLETVVVSAPTHNAVLVAPLKDKRALSSMKDPSFHLDITPHEVRFMRSEMLQTANDAAPNNTVKGMLRVSQSAPSLGGVLNTMPEGDSVFLTSITEAEKNGENKNMFRLDSLQPSKSSKEGIGMSGWDVGSEGERSRPVSRASESKQSPNKVTASLSAAVENRKISIENELKVLHYDGVSKFQKFGLGIDVNVRVSNMSGRALTSTSANVYVPNNTRLSDIVAFCLKVFNLNASLDWAFEYLPPHVRVWEMLKTDLEWLNTYKVCVDKEPSQRMPKFRMRRCPPKSPFFKSAKEESGTSGLLISTPNSIGGSSSHLRGLQEDVPHEMLRALSPSTNMLLGKNSTGESLGEKEVSGGAEGKTEDVDEQDSAVIRSGRASPEWDDSFAPLGGWDEQYEQSLPTLTDVPTGGGAAKKVAARQKQQDSVGPPSFLERQNNPVSEGRKKLAYYMRSQKYAEFFEQCDPAGRKLLYIPTNAPILQKPALKSGKYKKSGVDESRSIMHMLDIAHSPGWDVTAATLTRKRQKSRPRRKPPSVSKMKELSKSILKKFNAKPVEDSRLGAVEVNIKAVDKEASTNTILEPIEEDDVNQLSQSSKMFGAQSTFSLKSLSYSSDRTSRERLQMGYPKVKSRDTEERKRNRREIKREFLTENL